MTAIPMYHSNIITFIPVSCLLDFFLSASFLFRRASSRVPRESFNVQLHTKNVQCIQERSRARCRRDKRECAKVKQPEPTTRTGVRKRGRKREKVRRVGRDEGRGRGRKRRRRRVRSPVAGNRQKGTKMTPDEKGQDKNKDDRVWDEREDERDKKKSAMMNARYSLVSM